MAEKIKMQKRFNWPREKARRAAIIAAVWHLRSKRFTWRAIADALKITRWRADCIWHKEAHRRGDSYCQHQWKSGTIKLLTNTWQSLTCQKCGRVEYLNHNRKWTEFKKGHVKYPCEFV